MGSFADQHVPGFSEDELDQYDQVLQISDPELYNWICGREDLAERQSLPVLEKLLDHHYATASPAARDNRQT